MEFTTPDNMEDPLSFFLHHLISNRILINPVTQEFFERKLQRKKKQSQHHHQISTRSVDNKKGNLHIFILLLNYIVKTLFCYSTLIGSKTLIGWSYLQTIANCIYPVCPKIFPGKSTLYSKKLNLKIFNFKCFSRKKKKAQVFVLKK